ncbi:helix-turn-helix domain-containing protein [Streptomyces brasiliensis]|uniref:helix-turn-helix domain-containing protein n=1 Tax=Streptomyces brasiliensis TaxID=1954 RepID=UPI001E3FCF6E|nr:XRE family transcriptional regulator [Streptomyces brasiliensis]
MPDELDPQVGEFTSQLRRLVDRSGLSMAALADRTGYSKTSWERYLGGRLLAPKGAIVALAEVTGTNPIHLTTMWELAERAWSRSEMRHDMTMEAIRISQARAALGEFGGPPAGPGGGTAVRKGGNAAATPGIAGPAGVSPTIPPQPTGADVDARDSAARASGTGSNSWGVAGQQGPSSAGGRSAGTPAPSSPATGGGPEWSPTAAPNPYGEAPAGPGQQSGAPRSGGKRRLTMFLAGVVGVLVIIGGVYCFTGDGGDKKNEGTATRSPSPSASTDPSLPAGVKCAGAGCTGKDAEAMGCSGDLVTTAKAATVGTTSVEVRYSKTCGTAWGRITGAAQGDEVRVTAGGSSRTGDITAAGDTIAYTPMVAVKDAAEAKACAVLASGRTGCTN